MFKRNKEKKSEHTTYIYESNNKKKCWVPPIFDRKESEMILNHIEKYMGKPSYVYHEVFSDNVHIDVHYISPTSEKNHHTFITTGMSLMPMNVPIGEEEWKYAELMICLPANWKISDEDFKENRYYWPLGWLKMLARFPHEYKTWLSWGHTMPNGNPPQPFADNTDLCGVILLPPVLVDSDFAKFKISDKKIINFFGVIPLYKEELDYKLEYGYDMFIDKYVKFDMDELIKLDRKKFCNN